jgi:hypothetical protein
MSDDYKPQTGPSKVLNNAKTSRTDIEVSGQPADEKRLAKVLSDSLKTTGQSSSGRTKR